MGFSGVNGLKPFFHTILLSTVKKEKLEGLEEI